MGTNHLPVLRWPVPVSKHDRGDNPMSDGVTGSRREGLCPGEEELSYGITVQFSSGVGLGESSIFWSQFRFPLGIAIPLEIGSNFSASNLYHHNSK